MQQETKVEDKKIESVVENKYIDIQDFVKVEIMLGTIKSVQDVEGSDKLYKLSVDFGEYNEIESEGGLTEREEKFRTVFSGIKNLASVEDLLNKQYPFVTNLKPRKIMGEYSEAMILAASQFEDNQDPDIKDKKEILALMSPTNILANGTRLK